MRLAFSLIHCIMNTKLFQIQGHAPMHISRFHSAILKPLPLWPTAYNSAMLARPKNPTTDAQLFDTTITHIIAA